MFDIRMNVRSMGLSAGEGTVWCINDPEIAVKAERVEGQGKEGQNERQ